MIRSGESRRGTGKARYIQRISTISVMVYLLRNMEQTWLLYVKV